MAVPLHPPGAMIQQAVDLAAFFFEVVGVAVMVAGAIAGVPMVLLRRGISAETPRYHAYRQLLGRSILLGLEFLVGADIIRTVAELPTMSHVLVLGMIVLIRTFLSITLEVELEGRWPWQRQGERPAREDRVA